MSAHAERPQLRVVGASSEGLLGDEDTAHDGLRAVGAPSGEREVAAAPSDGWSPTEERPVCREGEQYGSVVIRSFVTRGGMGEVYEAFHPHMDQRVALKVLRKQFRERPDFVERFRDEGRVLAAICQKEPNVVQIRDVGFDDRCGPFITMEWLVGKNFAELIGAWGGVIPVAQAVHLAIRVADVTHRVHLLGLIHRDLKPANLFLERVPGGEPRLVLLDLGISKRIGGARTTDENRTLGTIDYMAPEQISTGTATAQSDVYALGIILFEMLSGDHPFGNAAREAEASGGADQRHLVMMGGHLYGTIEALPPSMAPDAQGPDGELSLARIVGRATAREPSERPASMEALATELRAWLSAHRAPTRKAAEPVRIDGLKEAVDGSAGPSSRVPRATARVVVPVPVPPSPGSPSPGSSSPGSSSPGSPSPGSPSPGSESAPKVRRVDAIEMTAMVSGCSLLVSGRGRANERYPLLEAVTRVGREEGEADLVIAHPTVSRVHCELRHVVPGVFQVVDLGSTHGLVIDQLPTRAGILRTGQMLRLGDIVLGLVGPGGWRKDESGKEVFVSSALDLPASERATVRMVGDASAPLGRILETPKALRPRGSPPSSRRSRASRPTPFLAKILRILYLFVLAALVLLGAAALVRLGMHLGELDQRNEASP